MTGIDIDSVGDLGLAARARSDAQRMEVLEHVPALDGLRGIAILLVLAIHFQLVPKVGLVERALFWFTSFGWVGVDLFFVLSGYLITNILIRARESPRYYASFYVRRVLRIFPLYYLLIGAFFLLSHAAHDGSTAAVWYLTYLQNFQMAWEGHTGPYALSITWSLAVEEQFYLIWPFLVRYASLPRLLWICLVVVVLAPVIRAGFCFVMDAPLAAYILMPSRSDSLAIGALVAVLHVRKALLTARSWALGASAVGLVVVLILTWLQKGFPFQAVGSLVVGVSALAWVFGGLLVAVLNSGPRSYVVRLFSWSPLRAVGQHSYAMYLLHYPIRDALTAVYPALASAEGVPMVWGTRWIAQVSFYVVAGFTTYVAAKAAWLLIERPFLSMKSRWSY